MASIPTPLTPTECDFLEGCRTYCCSPLQQPLTDHVMSPIIFVGIKSGEVNITVGNKSSPPFNHAVVKSLKYGHTTGGGGGGLNMQIEIADESGSEFFPIFQTLTKNLTFKKMVTGSQINVKWGWLGSRCDGSDILYNNMTEHTCFLKKVSCNYKHGLMTYILEATDITATAFQAAGNKSYGTDDQPMPLKEAIRQLCAKYSTDVRFVRPNSNSEWNFGQGGQKDGVSDPSFPKGTWRENSGNLIQVIMNWVAPYKTDRGKGIVPSFNSKRKLGSNEQLLLWEGFYPGCNETVDPCRYSLGTYIVNGGKSSPVLSFQPSFEWYFGAMNEAGGASGNTKNEQLPETGETQCNYGDKQDIKRGNPTYNVNTSDAVRNYGTKESLKRTVDSQIQHSKANAAFMPIRAELRIQGNPDLADPYTVSNKFVSIIVISPYHLRKDIPQGGRNKKPQTIDIEPCGDWLQEEPCHPVLSNRAWLVKGTYHEIKEGSYTTTLQLMLFAPGVDISIDRPLGNDPNAKATGNS